MGLYFEIYRNSLVKDIPLDVYYILGLVLIIGNVQLLAIKGIREGWRKSVGLFLIAYISLLLCSTVVFRNEAAKRQYDFMPFWSYQSYFRGEDPSLLAENIMNAAVFVPIGLLAGVAFRGMNWQKALMLGLGLSVFIEATQFIFMKGFSELDDVIHNTIGCLIGYGIYRMMCCLINCNGLKYVK